MNNILSIDFGERYFGIAVRTEKTRIPIPLNVVDTKKDDPLSVLKDYANEYKIQLIVIGYPIGLNNSENRMTNLVDEFINELDTLNLDVHKIERKYRRRFLEFWSFVEIKDADECWPWRGKYHSRSNSSYFPIPRHWGSGRQYSAQRVAAWFTWGDIGRLPIKAVCGNNNCCNPLHLRVKGVPHFFHNRHIQLVDLEFSSNKLTHETQLFLETTCEKDPRRFEKIQKAKSQKQYYYEIYTCSLYVHVRCL